MSKTPQLHPLIRYKAVIYTPDDPRWKQETTHYQTFEGAEFCTIIRTGGKLRAEIYERIDSSWILKKELLL